MKLCINNITYLRYKGIVCRIFFWESAISYAHNTVVDRYAAAVEYTVLYLDI